MSSYSSHTIDQESDVLAARGAYGLTFEGADLPAALFAPAPASAPLMRVTTTHEVDPQAVPADDELSEDHARLELPGGGWADLHRDPLQAAIHLPGAVLPTAMAHPYLAGAGSVAAYWRGALTFHAGAAVVAGRAWGILGQKGRGKSTTLAGLARAGLDVLTDDLLVIERGQALAGPRCIDLRRSASEAFPAAEALGVVGVRRRWRLTLGPAPWATPLAGWIDLAWGDTLDQAPVEFRTRLELLAASLSLGVRPVDPRALLDAAALPMVRITRPRDLGRLDDLVEAIAGLEPT